MSENTTDFSMDFEIKGSKITDLNINQEKISIEDD